MLLYIVKSAACLAVLFVFYKLFLEKENMHVFKRCYLLGALIFSLVVPTLIFTSYIEVQPVPALEFVPEIIEQVENAELENTLISETHTFDYNLILGSIYGLGLLFFGYRFLKNLSQIIQRIRRNPKYKTSNFIQVLLQEQIVPHTFFNYIFLNKTKLEANAIPKEVLLHEETHARQKHSIDVLFIELLQVLFWFNPLFYCFKRVIKLNHEFLADQAVLNKSVDIAQYQNTLLSLLSSENAKLNQASLSNAINYSSIKKRITIMKTKTTKKAVFYRSLILLPLLAVLLYGFSQRTIEVKETSENNAINEDVLETVWIEIKNENEIWFNNELIALEDLTKKITTDYETLAAENKLMVQIYSADVLKSDFLNKLTFEIQKLGSMKIEVFSEKYSMPESEYQNKIDITPETIILNANTLTLTDSQEDATKMELKEYNSLAKKYNKMLAKGKDIAIKIEDVKRLEYIYSLMSEAQKVKAEPYPDFPEPPAVPKAPVAPMMPKGEKSNIPAPPVPPNVPENSKTSSWTVSSGTNRSTRNVEDLTMIPPVAPTIAMHTDKTKYSNELKKVINEYLEANKKYEMAVSEYKTNGKDTTQNLWNLYNEAIEKYVAYHVLAKEEGNFVQPIPAYKPFIPTPPQ